MEPLRGGSLCKLPESAAKKLGKLRPNESATAWAFRFLQGIGATVILSGMSNQEQLEQNIATFAQDKPSFKGAASLDGAFSIKIKRNSIRN